MSQKLDGGVANLVQFTAVTRAFGERYALRDLDLDVREREVLGLIATGASNSAIAATLHVTSRAVEKHINSIFTKLDLPAGDRTHRRVAAVLLYLGDSGSTPTSVAAGPAV